MDKAQEAMTEGKARGRGKRPSRAARASDKQQGRPGLPARREANAKATLSGAPELLQPIHGPSRPPSNSFGREHLRKVLMLSTDADVDRLCEDAALEIQHFRATRPATSAWPD